MSGHQPPQSHINSSTRWKKWKCGHNYMVICDEADTADGPCPICTEDYKYDFGPIITSHPDGPLPYSPPYVDMPRRHSPSTDPQRDSHDSQPIKRRRGSRSEAHGLHDEGSTYYPRSSTFGADLGLGRKELGAKEYDKQVRAIMKERTDKVNKAFADAKEAERLQAAQQRNLALRQEFAHLGPEDAAKHADATIEREETAYQVKRNRMDRKNEKAKKARREEKANAV